MFDKYYEINEIAKQRVVEDIITKILKCSNQQTDLQYADDLAQDIYIQLLEMEDNKIQQLVEHNQMRYYLVGVIKHNLFSTTSKFYYKYKKHEFDLDEESIKKIIIED